MRNLFLNQDSTQCKTVCISLKDRKTTERQRFSEETQRSQWLYRWLLDWMFTSFALFSWLCFFSFWPLYPWRQNDLKSPEKCSVYLTGMFIFWNASPSWLTRMTHMLLQVHLEANGLYQQPVQESNVSFWFVCVSKAMILLFNNILLWAQVCYITTVTVVFWWTDRKRYRKRTK